MFSHMSICLFTLVGGTPSYQWGATPSPKLGQGVLHSQVWTGVGVPHPRSGWGYPYPRSGPEGTPWPELDGYPPIRYSGIAALAMQ